MKYKVGDKVKLKREPIWEDHILESIDNLPNRVATIKELSKGHIKGYWLKEIKWFWQDSIIECLVEEVEDLMLDRSEILDLRKD